MPRSSSAYQPPSTPLPQSFITKKSQILEAISVPSESYSDKSPKGSIDAPIVDLINELNAIDGIVTTSSCSGRVAVFVEGPKVPTTSSSNGHDDEQAVNNADDVTATTMKALTGSPAGKGGGKWLYVSHDPVAIPESRPEGFFTQLCGLTRSTCTSAASRERRAASSEDRGASSPRLVKLSFSPLILHVLCATLAHAKPLVTAAINAGFRESGVQSLKALNDPDAGVMVGVRTMGLSFETVVGVLRDGGGGGGGGDEVYEALVDEEYLRMMFEVVNERFDWNERRRERFVGEARRAYGGRSWEDKEDRARRLKEEGLRKQRELQEEKGKEGKAPRTVVETDTGIREMAGGNIDIVLTEDGEEGLVIDMFKDDCIKT